METIRWKWEQSSKLAYQGTSKIGSILLVWKATPPPVETSGWVIILFESEGLPLEDKKFISSTMGWDGALTEAREWAESKLYPLWVRKQSAHKTPPDFFQEATDTLKGWWTDFKSTIKAL